MRLLVIISITILIITTGCASEKTRPISKGEIKNVSFDYEVEMGGMDSVATKIKYWIKGTRMKIQMKNVIYYYDSEDDSIYTYDPIKNTAVKEPERKETPKGVIPPKRKDIPNEPLRDYFQAYNDLLHTAPKEENVEGGACLLFDLSTASKTDKFYISKQSKFPIKWEYISNQSSEYKYTSKVTIHNVKIDSVTNDDVVVPNTAVITKE